MRRTQPGQAMVEFALIAIVLLALVFAVIDLARAGFMQHDLDGGASDLASHLAALSGTNGGTPLDPSDTTDLTTFSTDPNLDPSVAITTTVSDAMQRYLNHAAQIANYNFNATPSLTFTSPLTVTGSTLKNGQVTVVAAPTLSTPTEITVTVTAPFTPVVGFILHNAVLHLQASASVRTPAGQLAQ